jgi:hypothetical protein
VTKVSEKVNLTIDGNPAGECDNDTFELVKIYISEGRTDAEIAKELKANGVPHAISVVVNAKREVGFNVGVL